MATKIKAILEIIILTVLLHGTHHCGVPQQWWVWRVGQKATPPCRAGHHKHQDLDQR